MTYMPTNLVYNLQAAGEAGELRHPQKYMRDCAITYLLAVPQSMGDCWWFFRCENVPQELPPFLCAREFDHKELVGWGLSPKDVADIDAYDAALGSQSASKVDAIPDGK